MLDLALLTTATWTALQPLLPIIAAKGAEELGKQAGGVLWETIKKKFDTKAAAKEALGDLLKSPNDSDLQAAFRVQLKKLLEEDPAFASNVDQLLKATGTTYTAHLEGDGAIAQGKGAKAVGAGGVMIGGNVSGSNVVMGDKNKISGSPEDESTDAPKSKGKK
jgi:hypothetical protein